MASILKFKKYDILVMIFPITAKSGTATNVVAAIALTVTLILRYFDFKDVGRMSAILDFPELY